MSSKERMFGMEKKWRLFGVSLTAVGALALTSCADNDKLETPETTTRVSTSGEASPDRSTPVAKASAKLIFDSLGGRGSTIIRVYPGVEATPADKQANGTFNNGDMVVAECKTEGRTVHSDTSLGEVDRTSDEWIRIQGTPGETQYATAVYIANPTAILAKLPDC